MSSRREISVAEDLIVKVERKSSSLPTAAQDCDTRRRDLIVGRST